MNNKRIGQNIKTFRRSCGMTQADLAEEAGVTIDHISHIEIGSGCISITLMIKICRSLGVTPNDILAGTYDLEFTNGYLCDDAIQLEKINPRARILLYELYEIMLNQSL